MLGELDRYVLKRELGRGAFGGVYLAEHKVLRTEVALKVLHPDHAQDPTGVDRFLREARAAASIGSPHIVRVSDAGISADQRVFLAMERLEGEDLAGYLARRARLGASEAVFLVRQILEGLAAAHAAGIVHRDMKPANVFLVRGPDGMPFAKILDFGISKMQQPVGLEGGLTATGVVIGTPHYMAPEQLVESRSVDARADLYSVAVMLYEMLAGQLPHPAESLGALFHSVLMTEPIDLRELAPEVPPALVAAVSRGLAKDPANRYASAFEMAESLRLALEGIGPTPMVPMTRAPAPETMPMPGRAPSTAPMGGHGSAPGALGPTAPMGGLGSGPGAFASTAPMGGAGSAPGIGGYGSAPSMPAAPAPRGRSLAWLALGGLALACLAVPCVGGAVMHERVGAAYAAFVGVAPSDDPSEGGGDPDTPREPSEPVVPMHDGTEEVIGNAGLSIERGSRRRAEDGRWIVDTPITIRSAGENALTFQQSEITADGYVSLAESDLPTFGMLAPGRAFSGYMVWRATEIGAPPPETLTVRFRGWARRVPVTDGPRLPPRPAPGG